MTTIPNHWNAQLSTDHMIHEMSSELLLKDCKIHVHEHSTMNSKTDGM